MKSQKFLYTLYVWTIIILQSSTLNAQKPIIVIKNPDNGKIENVPDGYDVEIKCNVPYANMYIDGIQNGNASGFRFLKKGKHVIKLEAEDYYNKEDEFVVDSKHKSFTFIMSGTEFAGKTVSQLYDVGEDYYYGRNGKPQNYAEALRWYKKAADKGHLNSCYSLGFMYNQGKGIQKDSLLAMDWYEKAAKLGHSNSQNNLAAIYYYAKDYSSAFKWFKLAANQNNSTALDWLGTMYKEGNVECDTMEAINCYAKSASLYFESKDYEKAFNVFSKVFPLKKNIRKKTTNETIKDARTIILKKYSNYFGTTVKKDPPYDKNEYIMDLEKISSYALYAMKYENSEKYSVEGIKLASDNLKFNSNLAASLLLQGKFYDAEKIYRKFKHEQSKFFMDELEAFCKAVKVPKEKEADIEIIKKLLRE